VLTAQAARAQAEVELARIMHRDPAAPFATVEGGLDDPLAIVADPRTQRYIDTPAKWGVFRSFTVKHALDRSPELARIDELIAGQDRAVTSARRAFFLPDLSLAGTSSDAISRSGAGSAPTPGAPNEESWSVSLQATLPLFTGGAQLAEFSSAKHQLRRLQAERAATEDAVRARALAALERIGASNASIGLSREAASAARENFASVTEAYSRGLVSVTDLIDAQSASLNAELAEAQAKYTFLIDFMDVLRAAGSFELLLDRAYRAAWYDEVDRWFRDHPPGSPAASQ
jgi:outer membrane protein